MNTVIDPTANPFVDQVVTSPRRAEPSIRGLNDSALNRLLSAFQRVSRAPARSERAQLIVSPSGGYGKSHLIGRLFADLGRRATRIYVRPFGDPETCWISLLNTIVQEMVMPEREGEAVRFGTPNQFDAFAHGLFGELLARLIREGDFRADPADAACQRLTSQALEKWDMSADNSSWGQWAAKVLLDHENAPAREARMVQLLLQSFPDGLSQNSRPQAWLRVLRRYSRDRSDAATREACLEWIRGRTPSDPPETQALGLLPSDGTDTGLSANARNEIARHRVLDLCSLARLFRPFVLCFDQTEVYARVPGMAKVFGSVISDLVQGEGAHMCVITANHDVWENQLQRNMERADADRIMPKVELQGLTREQGRSLACQRLVTVNAPEALRDRLLEDAWLDEVFARGQISARAYLQMCERRYDEVAHHISAANRASDLVGMLEEARYQIASSAASLQQFRQEIFRWALLDVPSRTTSAFTVTALPRDADGFEIEWRTKTKRRVFVLEDASHVTVWRRIARHAEELKSDPSAPAITIAPRLPTHPEIPHATWQGTHPEIKAATHSSLCIVRIHPETIAEVYAGWELYTKACQADIAASPEEIVAFLGQRFESWWGTLLNTEPAPAFAPVAVTASAIVAASAAQPAPAPNATNAPPQIPAPAAPEPVSTSSPENKRIVSALREIIARRLFASFAQIKSELSDAVRRPVTLSEAVSAAESMDELRVYLHPNNAAFLWQR
jgi:hypothetical protein